MSAARLSGPERSAEVDAYLGAQLQAVADELAKLRAFVHRVAAGTQGVGPLVESLKWGEPSLTPAKPGIGSSVRLSGRANGDVAVHFICHTGLVDRFRELYPNAFRYEGNRTVLVQSGHAVDEAALSHCIGMALTYHLSKRGG